MSVETNRHLLAAQGYIELGMLEDAWDELESLPPELRAHDVVLELRIAIYQCLGKWDSARMLAESLAKRSPEKIHWWIEWACSLRQEQSTEQARKVLMEAVALHPNEVRLPYMLACYACDDGQLGAARKLLQTAFSMDATLRRKALDEPDLGPLFEENSLATPPFVPPRPPESDPP
jgi:lipopolysaccharide biosynthesis regulator YciM